MGMNCPTCKKLAGGMTTKVDSVVYCDYECRNCGDAWTTEHLEEPRPPAPTDDAWAELTLLLAWLFGFGISVVAIQALGLSQNVLVALLVHLILWFPYRWYLCPILLKRAL